VVGHSRAEGEVKMLSQYLLNYYTGGKNLHTPDVKEVSDFMAKKVI
jgi:hypothetical protein